MQRFYRLYMLFIHYTEGCFLNDYIESKNIMRQTGKKEQISILITSQSATQFPAFLLKDKSWSSDYSTLSKQKQQTNQYWPHCHWHRVGDQMFPIMGWYRLHMVVKYGDFLKWWYSQIINFNITFHYKPSILTNPHLGNLHKSFLSNLLSCACFMVCIVRRSWGRFSCRK